MHNNCGCSRKSKSRYLWILRVLLTSICQILTPLLFRTWELWLNSQFTVQETKAFSCGLGIFSLSKSWLKICYCPKFGAIPQIWNFQNWGSLTVNQSQIDLQNPAWPTKPNLTYQTKSDLPIQPVTYQTKSNLPNLTWPTKPHLTYQTLPDPPNPSWLTNPRTLHQPSSEYAVLLNLFPSIRLIESLFHCIVYYVVVCTFSEGSLESGLFLY